MSEKSSIELNGGRAWGQFFIVLIMGITVAMGMFKVPTNFPLILQFFGCEMSTAAWLMSIVGLACIVTAIPAGAIMQKFGVKKFALICMIAAILECIIGAVAPTIEVMIASRLLCAISYGCISMVSVAIITGNFTAEKRGLPNGVWVIWVSVANMIVPQLVNAIAPNYGFQGVWWTVGVLQVIMLIVFMIVVKEPPSAGDAADGAEQKGSIVEGLKEPGTWLISLFCLGLAIGSGCYTGLYATYLQTGMGFEMVDANNIISISNIGGLIGCILVGAIINAVPVRKRSYLMIVLAIICIIFYALQFHIPTQYSIVLVFTILFSAVSNFNMPISFAIIPDMLKRPELLNMCLGILMIGANVGGALSMNIPSMLIDQAGGVWAACDWFVVGFGVIGLIAAIVTVIYQKKVVFPIQDARENK